MEELGAGGRRGWREFGVIADSELEEGLQVGGNKEMAEATRPHEELVGH